MKMKSIYTILIRKPVLLILLISLIQVSCTKFVQISPPPNQLVTSQVFADSSDASAALAGIYTKIYSPTSLLNFGNGGISIYTGLAADELYPNGGNTNFISEYQLYQDAVVANNNGIIGTFWINAYQYIYQANACIEGIPPSTGISQPLKNQLVGEAKLFRAFFYFNMINLYGPVPLVTSTDYHVNESMPRTSVDQVYQQIINDLIDAQSLLTENYPVAGSKGRPNKYAAMALLARVYLYRQQWANAEVMASQVINSGKYGLVTDLNKVFLAGSNEAIWQIVPVPAGAETTEGQLLVTQAGVQPNYTVTSYLLKAFEPNDLRKTNWLDSNVLGATAYYFPYKYKLQRDGNTSPKENYMIFRLGELYLVRAEARAQQGAAHFADAIADLTMIRNRSGLLPVNPGNQQDLLDTIYHERQVELFCEWGHRWFDIKRTGIVNTIMGIPGNICALKGGTWDANWQLWPIPFNELQLNPFLTQNEGYQ